MAALKLGAARVTAVDIDPQALTATRDNAARNGVGDARLHIDYPEGLGEKSTADLVLANILAGPLVELAPAMAGRVRPGGAIVLSGILREQAEPLRQAYTAWFDMDPPAFREDWTRLTGRRRND